MITVKTENDMAVLREGGRILARILNTLVMRVKPGVTTGDLEKLACRLITEAGGRPSFRGYPSGPNNEPFPTALCTSLNDEVVHAPSLPARRLKPGDIVSIDVGMEYPVKSGVRGLFTDTAATVAVGKVSRKTAELINVTRKALMLGTEQVKPGNTISAIGSAIENFVVPRGFSVVRDLVGHGVGYAVHEDPQIPHYAVKEYEAENIILKPGMVLAIEPMINVGSYKVTGGDDGFTILTRDGSLSAQFEHTVAVTDGGHEILTMFPVNPK